MLDSSEGVCPGQARFEYPATSVLFSNYGTHGVVRPAETVDSTALGRRSMEGWAGQSPAQMGLG
jgi:hypothetical protein